MKALILAGGKGTRLRPLTVYTPKPVVPVVNQPFLLYQIEILRRAGIDDIVLSLSYQPDKIEQVLGDGSQWDVHIKYVTEPTPLGTAGAYRFASDTVRDTTVVLNGDVFTDVDIAAIVNSHRKNAAQATIALKPVENPAAYGLVETAKDGRVLRFLEKPTAQNVVELGLNTINAGIYVLEPSVLELIPAGENQSFEYNVFPALLEGRSEFFAFDLGNTYWRDIGTPASYLDANLDFLAGRIALSGPQSLPAEIATAAAVDDRSVIGEGCSIKPNATVKNSVIGPGVVIEEKASVEDSVVWAHTRISSYAEIRNSIVARGCHIGRNVVISSGTVLGDKASIPDYSRI